MVAMCPGRVAYRLQYQLIVLLNRPGARERYGLPNYIDIHSLPSQERSLPGHVARDVDVYSTEG